MFNIRMTAPFQRPLETVPGDSVEDALGSYMERYFSHGLFVRGTPETVYFAIAEVEGRGQFCLRHFYAGIGRKGGVRQQNLNERLSLREVEQDLGLSEGALSAQGWQGEETIEDAFCRKFGRTQGKS